MNEVNLVPADNNDFSKFMAYAVENYAEEKTKSGNWKADEAKKKSEEVFSKLLPKGLETPGYNLMNIVVKEDGVKAGFLWFEMNNKESGGAYIWDIVVFSEFRGRGYGEAAMKALETIVREAGVSKITLHVFGHNKPAISLYEKLNYETTNMIMVKKLD